jgi:hypothetical protein
MIQRDRKATPTQESVMIETLLLGFLISCDPFSIGYFG